MVLHGQLRPRTTVCRVSARAVVAAAIQYPEERELLVRAGTVARVRVFNRMPPVVAAAPGPLVGTARRPTTRTRVREEATEEPVFRPASRVVPRFMVAAVAPACTEPRAPEVLGQPQGAGEQVAVVPERLWQVEVRASPPRVVSQIPAAVVVVRAYAVPWDTRVRVVLAAPASWSCGTRYQRCRSQTFPTLPTMDHHPPTISPH